MNDFVVK